MLPSQVTPQITQALEDYLQTTFAFTDPGLTDALKRFMRDGETGLFKGPYVSVRLPYKKASGPTPIRWTVLLRRLP